MPMGTFLPYVAIKRQQRPRTTKHHECVINTLTDMNSMIAASVHRLLQACWLLLTVAAAMGARYALQKNLRGQDECELHTARKAQEFFEESFRGKLSAVRAGHGMCGK